MQTTVPLYWYGFLGFLHLSRATGVLQLPGFALYILPLDSLLYNERIDLREILNILGFTLYQALPSILREFCRAVRKSKTAAAAFKFVGLQAVLLLIFIQTFRFWVSKNKEFRNSCFLGILSWILLLKRPDQAKISKQASMAASLQEWNNKSFGLTPETVES